jgi:hypothetical protein
MPRQRSEDKLEALRARAVELDKKIKEAAAHDRAKRAAEDVRRRLLVGTAALEHMAAAPESPFAATLLGLINDRVRSAADRALFNLPPVAMQQPKLPTVGLVNGSAGDAKAIDL